MGVALHVPRLDRPPLILRPFTTGDAALIREASTDPFIPAVTTVPRGPASDAAVLAFLDRQAQRAQTGQGYSFAIADAASDIALGQIGVWPLDEGRASLGYWVVASARRRGIAGKAIAMASEWALSELGLARLELYVEPWNEGSWRAAQGAGYEREGLLRGWQPVAGQRRDMYMYARVAANQAGDG